MDYMGIDHHKQYSHITLMDEKGKKLRSGPPTVLEGVLFMERSSNKATAGCAGEPLRLYSQV